MKALRKHDRRSKNIDECAEPYFARDLTVSTVVELGRI
jgi:hypothetical protein